MLGIRGSVWGVIFTVLVLAVAINYFSMNSPSEVYITTGGKLSYDRAEYNTQLETASSSHDQKLFFNNDINNQETSNTNIHYVTNTGHPDDLITLENFTHHREKNNKTDDLITDELTEVSINSFEEEAGIVDGMNALVETKNSNLGSDWENNTPEIDMNEELETVSIIHNNGFAFENRIPGVNSSESESVAEYVIDLESEIPGFQDSVSNGQRNSTTVNN